jgi:hypothetical protein
MDPDVIIHKANSISRKKSQIINYKQDTSPTAIKEATRNVISKVIKYSDDKNYEDTKLYECIYLQYKYNCFLECIFSLISIISSIVNYEATMSENKTELVELTASVVCFISSGLLYTSLIFDYLIMNKITCIVTKLPLRFVETGTSRLYLACYIAVFFFHPFPISRNVDIHFYNKKYDVNYTIPLNGFFALMCFFRLWFLIKYYLVSSPYFEPRTQRICAMNGFNTDLFFSLKGNVKNNPFEILGVLFTCLFFFFSYGIRIFERGLDGKAAATFSNYYNCLWCLVITMTTVGYGDTTPSTELGQFLVIVNCFCGVMLLSMLIIAITNMLNLEGNEKSIYIMLERIDLMNEKDTLASKVVSRYTNLLKKTRNREQIDINVEIDMFRYTLHNFKAKKLELKNSFPVYSEMDNIRENLDFLEDTITEVKNEYNYISSVADKILERIDIKAVKATE